MRYTVAQIHEILGLDPPVIQGKHRIFHLLTDSRNLSFPDGTLFIAIRSSHQNGHHFISELYEKGVRAFLINEDQDHNLFPEAAFIRVPDTISALQRLAANWRNNFQIPVIGITGSNGKTIVKEWIHQLLADDLHIVRSPKSYNSQIGVPLSLALINSAHQMGVFEAGISQPGEMARVEKMIRPAIGIFTNIGAAHAAGFRNVRQKIREKLLLFAHSQLLIYKDDHTILNEEIASLYKKRQASEKPIVLFSWSVQKTERETSKTQLVITRIRERKDENGNFLSLIEGKYKGEKKAIEIPFTDSGSVENAIHCWCLLLYLEIEEARVISRMKRLTPVAMRLEMKPGIQNCTLINDSYNSDFTSIKVALDFLSYQRQHSKHTLIFSDVAQSGEDEVGLYRQIANLVHEKKVDHFIGIGAALYRQKRSFEAFREMRCSFYPSTEFFLRELSSRLPLYTLPFQDEAILIKGARAFGFERISRLLEKKKHQTELEINLNAIVHNLKTYQQLLKPGVRTMVMVKAFSYGSGSTEIANVLQFHKVDYLAVANVDEGIELRKGGIRIPIMVLNPDPYYFDALIQWKLEPELYSLSILKRFQIQLKNQGVAHYPVHIILDTGMHRLGFSPNEIPEVARFLKEQSVIKVVSVFSHLAAAEEPNKDGFTNRQAFLFEKMSQKITAVLPYPVIRHLANTAGISRHPDLQYDMVRLGIGLYGIDATMGNKLQVVHTLRTTISQIKNVPAGETVGYGRAGRVDSDKRIATVAVGYADGYLRSLGMGKAQMFLHGKPAPVIGNICMDMLMLDITHIPEAREGDTVIVFGHHPRIEELATLGNTIPYEILTGLSRRIVRIYVQE